MLACATKSRRVCSLDTERSSGLLDGIKTIGPGSLVLFVSRSESLGEERLSEDPPFALTQSAFRFGSAD